jgi:hypothetical protein
MITHIQFQRQRRARRPPRLSWDCEHHNKQNPTNLENKHIQRTIISLLYSPFAGSKQRAANTPRRAVKSRIGAILTAGSSFLAQEGQKGGVAKRSDQQEERDGCSSVRATRESRKGLISLCGTYNFRIQEGTSLEYCLVLYTF